MIVLYFILEEKKKKKSMIHVTGYLIAIMLYNLQKEFDKYFYSLT